MSLFADHMPSRQQLLTREAMWAPPAARWRAHNGKSAHTPEHTQEYTHLILALPSQS